MMKLVIAIREDNKAEALRVLTEACRAIQQAYGHTDDDESPVYRAWVEPVQPDLYSHHPLCAHRLSQGRREVPCDCGAWV